MNIKNGFSLIELLVTMAISAIVLAIATPSFSAFTTNQKIKSSGQSLNSALQLARTEAVKRRTNIYLTANGTWDNGWVLTTLPSRTYSQCVSSATSDCIRIFDSHNNISLLPSTSGVAQISYDRSGRLTLGSFSFTVCDEALSPNITQRIVSIQTNGLPYTSYGQLCS